MLNAGMKEDKQFWRTSLQLAQQVDQQLVGRARAEKAAEFEVEHNWMLKEEAEIKVKKLDRTKKKLTIILPGRYSDDTFGELSLS